MANILDRIVADKRNEVAQAKRTAPLAELRRRVDTASPVRNFREALRPPATNGVHLIAEIKRRSPSAGLIRENFDLEAIAQTYQTAGASAISVLTDATYFDGKLEYLRRVREVVTLPVLRKDFVVDAYQLWEARANDADAILLIAEVLDSSELVDLVQLTADLGMTALVEAYQPDLLANVLQCLSPPLPSHMLIGINNRDLTCQVTDLSTTVRLAKTMKDTSVLVSESGIKTRNDVCVVQEAGARAILVGETIMAANNMTAKIHELLGITRC